MRFIRVTTRVTTAQSMMTKVNRSPYVTIVPTPFVKSGSWYTALIGSPVKYIIVKVLCVLFWTAWGYFELVWSVVLLL